MNTMKQYVPLKDKNLNIYFVHGENWYPIRHEWVPAVQNSVKLKTYEYSVLRTQFKSCLGS